MKWHSWEVFLSSTHSCKTPALNTTQGDQHTEHLISHPAHSTQVFLSLVSTFLCFLFPVLVSKNKIMQQNFFPLWKFPSGMCISSCSLLTPALQTLFYLWAQAAAQVDLAWAWIHPTSETLNWSSCPTTLTQLPALTAAMQIRPKPYSATPNKASVASSTTKSTEHYAALTLTSSVI